MSELDDRQLERHTVFVLAGLLLVAIVSIAFFNLDRHPAFLEPTDEFIAEVDAAEPSLIAANNPVALATLEQHHPDLDAAIVPLSDWPPQMSVFTFGTVRPPLDEAGFERVASESVWSLYAPVDAAEFPLFATAVVEIVADDGTTRRCRREAGNAHQCGDAGWTRVRMREITVDGESEECIWSHPIDAATLRIRFSDAPTSGPDGEPLLLETALRDDAVGTGTPVDFSVIVDDQTRSHRHADRRGWQSVEVPAADEPTELIVEVSADDVGRRHACFRFGWAE